MNIESSQQIFSQNDHPATSTNGFKINKILENTECKVFKFDKVMDSNLSDLDIYKDNFEKLIEDCLLKDKNLLVFSFSKSNSILNYQLDEPSFTTSIMNINTSATNIDGFSCGILPLMIANIMGSIQKSKSKIESIFDEDKSFDTITFSSFTIQNGKIQNLIFPSDTNNIEDTKPLKEIVKINIDNTNTLKQLCMSVRSHLITKKLPLNFIIYRIKLHNKKKKDNKYSKTNIVFFDLLNIYDKDRSDKLELLKQENTFIDNFTLPLRIIYTLLTNTKNQNVIFIL